MFKTPYGTRVRVSETEFGPSMAKQSFKAECDVNTILSKYQRTGLLDHVNRFQGDYSDVASYSDYQTSVNQVMDAHDAFMTLPSALRKKFDNEPARFLEFVQDPSNFDEMISMGLAKKKAVEPDTKPPEDKPLADEKSSA